MEKKFLQASHLKSGNYVLIDEVPCRIMSIEKSKAGKHGASKVRIVGIGLFDESKRTLLLPGSADAVIPIIKRSNGQIVAVMGETLQVMDLSSYETFNVKKTSETPEVKPGDEVEYIRVDENVKIVRKK